MTTKMYKIPKIDIERATSHGDKTDFDLFKKWLEETEVDYYDFIYGFRNIEIPRFFKIKKADVKDGYLAERNSLEWFDHAMKYRSTKTGKRYIVSHLYHLEQETLNELFEWCDKNGLETTILPYSWYYPNVATAVQITKKE